MALMLKEIIEKCTALDVYEKRSLGADYAELVFYTRDKDKWNKLFEDILGPAVKPEGKRESEENLILTRDYGGIRANQTLFKKESGNTVLMAMFWPWGDGEHTTLKLISKQSS